MVGLPETGETAEEGWKAQQEEVSAAHRGDWGRCLPGGHAWDQNSSISYKESRGSTAEKQRDQVKVRGIGKGCVKAERGGKGSLLWRII